jgi:hypothetical protein
VHSAQGATADTTHVVLGENVTRALLYVGMTCGRESNTAYPQRTAGEADHQHREREDPYAAHLLRNIIATRDEPAQTAHNAGTATESEHLPEPAGSFVDRRAKAAERRRKNYVSWQEQTHTATSGNERWREHHVTRTSNPGYGIQL